MVYDILHGRVNFLIDEFFETPANPNLRGYRFKLRHQPSHLARRTFAFPVRIVEPWNKLPPEVVDSASEEFFKRRLDGVWDTLFLPLPPSAIQHVCFYCFVSTLCTTASSWILSAPGHFPRPLNIPISLYRLCLHIRHRTIYGDI